MNKGISILFLLCVMSGFAQINPFESIGKEAEVLTLSRGRYSEVYSNDSLQRIGSVIVNMNTGTIYQFLNEDTLYSESTLDPTIISRWWSVDPLIAKFPNASPYAAFNNNPILYIDPNGKSGIVTIDKNTKTVTLSAKVYLYGTGASKTLVDNANSFVKNELSKVNSMQVNGETYKIVWDVNFETATEQSAKIALGWGPNGETGNLDVSVNYVRVESSNEHQKQNPSEDLVGAVDLLTGESILGEVSHYDQDGNTGFFTTSGFANVSDNVFTIFHEFFHGLGLKHDKRLDEGSVPGAMVAPQGDASKFPNADNTFKEKISFGGKDLEVMTGEGQIGLTDLLSAFILNNSGVSLDGQVEGGETNWTGIKGVEFDSNNQATYNFGRTSNVYYDKMGKDYEKKK